MKLQLASALVQRDADVRKKNYGILKTTIIVSVTKFAVVTWRRVTKNEFKFEFSSIFVRRKKENVLILKDISIFSLRCSRSNSKDCGWIRNSPERISLGRRTVQAEQVVLWCDCDQQQIFVDGEHQERTFRNFHELNVQFDYRQHIVSARLNLTKFG